MAKTNNNRKNNHKNGRPTRFTKALQAALLKAIEKGLCRTAACKTVGLHYDTFRRWREKADDDEAPFSEFFVAVEKAEAKFEQRMLDIVMDAPTVDGKNWQAAAWILERRWPERYGRRDRIEAQHTGDVKLIVEWAEGDGKPD